MKFEIRYYWFRNEASVAVLQRDMSVPAYEIDSEKREEIVSLLERGMGLKRHETERQIFYTSRINANESVEYIIHK